MTPEDSAYLRGLHHAALIVQLRAGDKHSPYSDDIMKAYTTEKLKMEKSDDGKLES